MRTFFWAVIGVLIVSCNKIPEEITSTGSSTNTGTGTGNGGNGTGTGGGNTGTGGGGTKPPPVAVAGPDKNITMLTHYTSDVLNGHQSYDSSGTPLAFSWRQIGGAAVIPMPNPQSAECWVGYFTLPGTYSFELKVSNSNGSDLDSVDLVVSFPAFCQANRTEIPVSLTFLSDIPEHVQDPELIAAGNKLIVPGWFNNHTATVGKTMYIYDRSSRNWTTTEASKARFGAVSIVAGDKVFFAGGYDDGFSDFSSVVDMYDVATQTWSVTQLSEARCFIKAVVAGTRIFFAGGLKSTISFSNTVDIYDLESESWSASVLPAGARTVGAAVTAGNKILFCGGLLEIGNLTAGNDVSSNKIDILDIPTGQWSVETMKLTKSGFAAISEGENVFLAGGLLEESKPTFAVEKWNVQTMNSSPSCLYQPINFLHDRDAVQKDNWIVFFSNSFNSGVDHRKFDIYNTQTGLWSVGVLPPGISPGTNATAITSVNNEIFVIINDKLYKMNL